MTSIESLYSDRAKAVLGNYFPFPERRVYPQDRGRTRSQ
jgi:hypothetical protein